MIESHSQDRQERLAIDPRLRGFESIGMEAVVMPFFPEFPLPRSPRVGARPFLLLTVMAMLGGCGGQSVTDPVRVLADTTETPARHEAAMRMLEATSDSETTDRMLQQVLVNDGYAVASREAAFDVLARRDAEDLEAFLQINLPRVSAPLWRARLCELIAERSWIDLTPALIRAWARPIPGWIGEPEERPERAALVQMYGEEQLPTVLMRVMLDADPIVAANLRARCWELLVAEGRRDVVADLLENAEVAENDGMFRDLRDIATRTGIIPENREEIIWARALCRPENRGMLDAATEAVGRLSPERRAGLELRDLSVLVGAMRLDPSLLQLDEAQLAAGLSADIDPDGRRVYTADFTGYAGRYTERLREVRDKLDWGDLLALRVAVEAISLEPIRAHLFDHAERDLLDRTTEHGGVIAIDGQGRFEVLEFEPRTRAGDIRFEASQELFEAGYGGVFHFHHHAQTYENRDYAGPHLGDFQYAESTRANCLVFTFIDSSTLNADYYRHGGVVVDLGQINRPG
jgi:hypothetical protein